MSRLFAFRIHFGLLAPVFVLLLLSLTTLFSISFDLFKSQLVFAVISFAAYLFFAQFNYKIIQRYALFLYFFSVAVLVFVLFFGVESRGAVRWLDIFGLRVQFSEILKPFLAVGLASFLADRRPSGSTVLRVLLFLLPVVFLIYKQPDLGNTLMYVLVVVLGLLVYGVPYVWYGVGIIVLVLCIPFASHFLREYQKQRILTFLHPANDPLGNSYNAIQSIIAVGSGMVVGKGLGESTQSGLRFLPERHTDFIFATLSEELGLIGAAIVIGAFVWLLYVLYKTFCEVHEGYSKIFSIFAFFLIFVQFFVNIGMNIGIVPIVGITLPFVSYGGSSLLSNFILLGFLTSIDQKEKNERVLEIR